MAAIGSTWVSTSWVSTGGWVANSWAAAVVAVVTAVLSAHVRERRAFHVRRRRFI